MGARAAAGEKGRRSNVWPLPKSRGELAEQARGAVLRSLADGSSRQRVEWRLPVVKRSYSLRFDADAQARASVPAPSTKEEFYAAVVAASELLAGSPSSPDLYKRRVDDQLDDEPVALLSSSASPLSMLSGTRALVFPTAETMPFIQEVLQEDKSRPLVLVNPQWSLTRNILDDFGFGANRRRAREFADSFLPSYSLAELNIGNTRSVDKRVARKSGTVWLLFCYPGGWQVYAAPPPWLEPSTSSSDTPELLGVLDHSPSYSELEGLLKERNMSRLVNGASSPSSSSSSSSSRPSSRSGAESESETANPPRMHHSLSSAANDPWFPSGEIDRMPPHLLVAGLNALGENADKSALDGHETADTDSLRKRLKNAVMRRRGRLVAEGELRTDESEEDHDRCRVCADEGTRPCPMCAPSGRANVSCEFCGGWTYTLCPACGGGMVDVAADNSAETFRRIYAKPGSNGNGARASGGEKKSGRAMSGRRGCSICGEPGHNRRSCPHEQLLRAS
jgi:hypothetical protein